VRYLIVGLLCLSVSLHTGCATAPSSAGVSDVDDEFDTDLSETEADTSATAQNDNLDSLDNELDSSEAQEAQPSGQELSDLDETPAAPPPATEDKFAQEPPSTETPPPAVEEPAVSESPSPEGEPVEITGIEFRAHEGGGTVVITTTGKATYTTRSNPENQQYVIEVMNATLPAKLKRPYNTKEFPSPIAGIQAYQNAGSKTARIVVQLREPMEPIVQQAGNRITLSPSQESVASSSKETTVGEGEAAEDMAPSALNNQSIDQFLLDQSKFYGRKISIQFRDADIRDVFNFISEESGLNIILTEDVTGKVSLKLRQVPWDQALIVIMKSKQLGYVRQGNVIRISSLSTLQTEADAARNVLESQAKLRPLKVKVFPVSYAKVNELEIQAKEFLSPRGKVKGDIRTNSLIVNDLEENIERVGRLVEILDTETPQVLIEAKIIEARQEFQQRVGLSWTLQNGNIPMGQANGIPLSMRPTFNMAAQSAAPINANLQIGTFDLLGDIDATLNLYESEGIVRVISAPRVVTLNGIKANIEQTTELPFKRTDTTSAIMTETVQFKPVTLKLDVQPQITADGSVIMAVQVTREFPGPDAGGGNRPVNRRHANTTLLVRNGQTTVLGGIYQSDVTEGESGVPFLRKLPIVGGLFRGRSIARDKNELMIFMTPRILNKERAFRQQAKEES